MDNRRGRGNFLGSGVVGAAQWFVDRYGPAAAHAVIAKLTPESREYVKPNQPVLGLLGSRLYPYAMVGDMMRAMVVVARAPDEDAFIREIVAAGMDATLSTINRIAIRYMVSPQEYAKRAQSVWDLYHDSGRITVLLATSQEYLVQLSDWPNHDVTVCKICMEARRRVLETMGLKNVEARREKCQAWGHDVCLVRYRWT